jgi:DNA-directed RNA polymerase subunit RPC12/RpoP
MSKEPLYPHIPGKKHTVLKIVCAWCGRELGTKDGLGIEGTTHSICPECYNKALKR